MKYMGSKNRIAKEILPIILKDRKEGQTFIDCFCGGGNIADKVNGLVIANDYDIDVIAALSVIRDNIAMLPKNNKEFTENDYKAMRNTPNNVLYGYVAFALSYAGKKWGGWCRDKQSKRDYVAEAYRNAVRQSKNLQNVKLCSGSYDELTVIDTEDSAILYCDIPYKDTTKYSKAFDYVKFYTWCRLKSKEGHKVFISEYQMPDDFKCVWEKEVNSSLTQNTGSKKAIERLFTI